MGWFSELFSPAKRTGQKSSVASCPCSVPYVILDVETTGLSPTTDKIIQLSAIKYSAQGTPVDTYDTYLNPGISIPSKITGITGISDRTVRNAPTSDRVKNQFLSFISDFLLVGYNISFDLRFLTAEFGDFLNGREYVDALPIARNFLYCSDYKLSTVAEECGFFPDGGFHNSLADCEAVAAVLSRLDVPFEEYSKFWGTHILYDGPSEAEKKERRDWERWLAASQPAFLKGEEARKDGRLDEALLMYEQAKARSGVVYPFLYESYAMVYRKQKDYMKEVQILDEGISRLGAEKCPSLVERRKKAVQRRTAQVAAMQKAEAQSIKKVERAERKLREAEALKNKPKTQIGRPILKLDDDGTILEEFPSVSAAEKAVGVSSKSIRSAASGKQKHAGGYCWKYADVETEAKP